MAPEKYVMMQDAQRQVILYKNHLEVRLEKDTVWLTQKQMSDLFDKDTDTIGLHLRNIYKENELEESATTEESSVVQVGKTWLCHSPFVIARRPSGAVAISMTSNKGAVVESCELKEKIEKMRKVPPHNQISNGGE